MSADGVNTLRGRVQSRANLVLVSQNTLATLQAFAQDRGPQFLIASVAGITVNKDMGWEREGPALTGIPTFHRDAEGFITGIATEQVRPFDMFCNTWHLMAHFKDRVNDWELQECYD